MKRLKVFVLIILTVCLLTGCGKNKTENVAEEIKQLVLSGNLVTYQAYYHNVLTHDKKPGSGVTHWLEKERKLFAEYTGTIRYGIDLTKVKVEQKGDTINILIPKAKMIGNPNVDKSDFDAKNFIESKDGFINKNEITVDDVSEAFDSAQAKMKEIGMNDEQTLSLAQRRAKVLLENNIEQMIDTSDCKINWEFE